jgi:DNA-binding NtrC family response regulator
MRPDGVGTKFAKARLEGKIEMLSKKIIVVEDEESIRKTFNLILNEKYRVYLAKDGQEAVRRFHAVRADLLIVDLKLPDINGLELIAQFRELGYRGEAILISAFPDLVNIEQLTRHSVSHFFVKPLDLDVLSRSIDFLLTPRVDPEKRV